jgi:signal transduction histidine kinase/CheY-like chemotaxis protein
MKLISEKKTSLFYLLAATLLVSVLTAFYFSNQKAKSVSNLVAHTQDVLFKSNEILLDVLNIETSSRGYLLSGNATFLTPYIEGVTMINNNLLQLGKLTKDNENQQKRIDSLQQTVSKKLILTKNIIETKTLHEVNEVEKIELLKAAQALTNRIRNLIDAINAEELNLLTQRKIDNITTNKYSNLLFLLLLFFIIIIAALITFIIKNQKSRNRELEDFNAVQKRNEIDLIDAKTFAESAAAAAKIEKVKAEHSAKIAKEATKKAENWAKEAEEAMKAKQQFLSTMSHEIRTPMNAILGFTKVILKTDLTAKQLEYLTAIKSSGDTLIVLINDILDLAKVEAGKMTFEKTPFKLTASLSSMLHLFEVKMQENKVELIKEYDPRIPETLMGDAIRLHQIILNLVGNAVKFTEKGCIKVSTLLLNEDAQSVTIQFAVTDTGIGIAEDKIAKIFDSFQQASNETARLFGGTGLGLAIVKQLVEAQGGKMSVTSKITEGSVFSFTLTFLKADITAELNPEVIELNTDLKNLKVLVVEDMKLNQLLMQTILDDFGFEHDMADNGLIAVEKLKNKVYDIILMDLQMPEMNGFEATEHIRNTLKLTVPIIALTADVTTVDVAKCTAVGMNDYVSKPLDERILYAKIRNLVKTF